MKIEPYPDDVAVCGPETPDIDQIDDLIRLLVTIRHRFGNTAVRFNRLCWGATALWASDSQAKRIDAIREAVEQIVVTEGEDTGVVLLSNDSPTKYDPHLKCEVYTHLNFSPLGDALIALHGLCESPKASE